MKQLKTQAIILSRINFKETDRIITVITPDYGKLRLIARGSRSLKSKLAGSIELFTTNEISFIKGRGEIATLVSGRLDKYYPDILKDVNRVTLGYELLKDINRHTEDRVDKDYYYLLEGTFALLGDLSFSVGIIRVWFILRLLAMSGHGPNLSSDIYGHEMNQDSYFSFDIEKMAFYTDPNGKFMADHIKLMRLALSSPSGLDVFRVASADKLGGDILPLLIMMRDQYL